MDITTVAIMSLVLLVVQIGGFLALPTWMRNGLAFFPILGFGVNLALSSMVLHFVGLAYGIGIANMVASILFTGYIWGYKNYRELTINNDKWYPRIVALHKESSILF